LKKVTLTPQQQRLLKENTQEFLSRALPGQPVADLFRAFHEYFIGQVMVAYGFKSRFEADALIAKGVQTPELISFPLLLPREIAKSFVHGRYEDSNKIFESYLSWLAEQHAQKSRRASRAERPNRKGQIGKLIDQLVLNNPNITEPELLSELRKHERLGVISTIEDGEIVAEDGSTVSISAIRGRLSRSKKKLSK
jgi:hypothetical protein